MLVQTKTMSGRSRYFDQKGKPVPVRRETGRNMGHLPDYAFRFLTPGPQKAPNLIGADELPVRRINFEADTPEVQKKWAVWYWFVKLKNLWAWLTKKR